MSVTLSATALLPVADNDLFDQIDGQRQVLREPQQLVPTLLVGMWRAPHIEDVETHVGDAFVPHHCRHRVAVHARTPWVAEDQFAVEAVQHWASEQVVHVPVRYRLERAAEQSSARAVDQ